MALELLKSRQDMETEHQAQAMLRAGEIARSEYYAQQQQEARPLLAIEDGSAEYDGGGDQYTEGYEVVEYQVEECDGGNYGAEDDYAQRLTIDES